MKSTISFIALLISPNITVAHGLLGIGGQVRESVKFNRRSFQ